MNEKSVLYKIKSLDQSILRVLGIDSKETINYKITPTQMHIVKYIIDNESKDVYQRDLEELLNLRRATVSGVLQTMEKNNLIERVICSSDARTKKIILKEDAIRIYQKGEKNLKQLEKKLLDNISNEELNMFNSVINKMNKNISELSYDKKGE